MVRTSLVLALLFAAPLPFAAERPHPDQAAAALDAAVVDPTQAVDAVGLSLKLDFARLDIEAGVLLPVRTDHAAEPLEWVFVGRARLSGRPPSGVEQDQLVHFSGERVLDVTVTRAVIVPGGRWAGQDPGTRPSRLPDAAQRAAAEELFREWSEEAERAGFGATQALIRALLGDPVGQHFSGVWGDTRELGRLFFAVDPGAKEPVQLGALRLYEWQDFLTKRQRKRAQRRKARASLGNAPQDAEEAAEEPAPCGHRDDGLSPALERQIDYYVGDAALPWIRTWVTAPMSGSDPEGEPPGFEPEHYEIELNLAGEDLDGRGTAQIRLRPNLDGLVVVPLELVRGVDVCGVQDDEGRSLPFHERGRSVLVALEDPTRADQRLNLTVEFAGRPVVKWLGRRNLRDTIHWHPHAGRLDRASYDVTLRWPQELKLLASGKLVDGGTENGQHWMRRWISVPAIGFSFEVDEFDVVEDEAGHLKLSFAFYPDDEAMTEERRAEIVKTVKAAILYYETRLGRLAIDELSVVVTDRGFSQGLLGFLTLAQRALDVTPWSLYDNRTGQEVRLALIAHEVAHQWWGNQVGWESYRDQWLSEALATFSSTRFMTEIADQPLDYLQRAAKLRRATLGYQMTSGQPTASVGSVLLGRRVLANHGPAVYRAVVYVKGAAVFSTLAERLGPDQTWEMLGSLARAVNHRVIRSETFFSAMERMSGQDLAGFFEQYVAGAGMPLLVYEYTTRPDSQDGARVEGVVHQLPPARFRYAAVRTDRGWDVRRRVENEPAVDDWQLSIPFVVDTSTGDEPSGIHGDLAIRGGRTEFTIPLDREARRLMLDPAGVVLADVVGAASGSGETLFRRGEHAMLLGRNDEARQLLTAALEAAAGPEADARLAAQAHTALARMRLDAGDLPEARAALRAASKLLQADPEFMLGERTVLAARLELLAGNGDEAADLLNRFSERYAFELGNLDPEALLDPSRASHLQYARGEMLALLALAQFQQGSKNAALLIRMADLAGVDMTALSTH